MQSPLRGNLFTLGMLLFPFIIAIMLLFYDFIPTNPAGSIVVSQMLMFFVPFLLYKILTKQKFSEILMFKKLSFGNILLIAAIIFTLTPSMMLISFVSSLFFNNYIADVMEEVVTIPFFLGIFAMGVVPSVFEEITFRGALANEYKKVPVHKAALVNGLFFGIMHGNLQQFFYTATLGVLMFYFLYYTKSIWAPMIAHFFVNGPSFALGYLAINVLPYVMEGEYAEYVESPEEISMVAVAIGLGVIAAIFAIPAFFLAREFFRHNKPNTEISAEEETEEESPENQKVINWPFFLIIVYFILFVVL